MRGEAYLMMVILAFFLILSTFAQTSGGEFGFSCQISDQDDSSELKVNYILGESRFSKRVNVVTYSTSQDREDHVYIFYDHPGVNGSFYTRVSGLLDHMSAKFDLYGYSGGVSIVDREGLENVIQGPNATLILASQPSNDTDISQLMLEWVESGGVLVGIGNKSVPFVKDPRYDAVEEGDIALRFDDMAFNDGEGMATSTWATAFDFEVIAPTKGIFVQDVMDEAGKVIGYTYQRGEILTSSALFEIGEGLLLVMSGDMFFPIITSGEEAYANDLCRLIAGNALWMEGEPIMNHVSAGTEEVSGEMEVNLPRSRFIMVVALDTDEFQDVFHSRTFQG